MSSLRRIRALTYPEQEYFAHRSRKIDKLSSRDPFAPKSPPHQPVAACQAIKAVAFHHAQTPKNKAKRDQWVVYPNRQPRVYTQALSA